MAPRKHEDSDEPAVRTPSSVRTVAAIGIPISLAASAAVSFQGLTGLGALVGISDPWLLPIAIDVYAVTSTLIAMLLPENHRARKTAVWNARLGLAMSMSGNAAYRAIHLGSYTLSDAILTFVGAWPSAIVERLLHLQGRLADSTPTAATGSSEQQTGNTDDIDNMNGTDNNEDPSSDLDDNVPDHETDKTPDNPVTVNGPLDRQPVIVNTPGNGKPENRQAAPAKRNADGQPSTDTWVEIGKPIYDQLRAELGKRPGETKFHAALTDRVTALIADGLQPEVYADPSLSTAKRIRGEIEDRFPGIMFGHHVPEALADLTEDVA